MAAQASTPPRGASSAHLAAPGHYAAMPTAPARRRSSAGATLTGLALCVACGSGSASGAAPDGGSGPGAAGVAGAVTTGLGGATSASGGAGSGTGLATSGGGNSSAGGGGAPAGGSSPGGGGTTVLGGAGSGGIPSTSAGSGPMGTGGGTFVMCDDHADFNGRGRCAPSGKVGAVFAFEDLRLGAPLTTVTATFGSTQPPREAGCTTEALGGCSVLTCPKNRAAGATGPAAGTITVKSSGGSMTTTPDASGQYDVVQFAAPLWSPMAALAFAASGGTTPAFGESFCGPTGVKITAPAALPGALVVSRNSDLGLQWTGSAAGDFELVFRDDSSSPDSVVELQCFFTAASGQGTVGKAALAQLPAGTHQVASYTWVRKIGGGGSGTCTELTGIMTNSASDGTTPFNGTATFQ